MTLQEEKLKLFMLNNVTIETELKSVLVSNGLIIERTAVERAADELVAGYIAQFRLASQTKARRMSEFYELFHMFENSIRDLIEDTLSGSKPATWWEDLVPENIKVNAKKNYEKELNEGLSRRSERLIDYTNFGELGEIIKYNWSIFGGLFTRGSIPSLEKIVARLNVLRAPIAHCATLSETEVLRLKLTVHDWYKLMA